ncbi:beta strand repeat-containing protein [Ferrovum myxofaciens]|uniref:beta strand repeat-containing protein n=1 Tax=Ferrovum myxofaciens TaxID=416213 RepID=UPI00235247A1|nr:hypothetical protein [Ferrovum myxofaciens]MBU6993425.1 hypothetical protein [Ferrovum myxofaciens]
MSAYNFDGHGPTLTVGDNLIGSQTGVGANNTLTLIDGYSKGIDIVPAGITLNNIQTVSLETAGNAGVPGNPFNTSPYSSVTNTTVSSSGGNGDTVQASATSTISVTHNSTAGSATVYGGSSVTVNSNGMGGITIGGNGLNQLPSATGTVTVNANGTGASAGTVTVMGGQAVNVTVATASSTGNISIGNSGLTSLTKADNPTGAITVTSNSLNGSGNLDTIMGGTTVGVTVKGDNVTIGDSAATDASNQPSGNVTVSDMQTKAYDNLSGPGTSHNNVAGGYIEVYGGANVNVNANTGGGVFVGNAGVAGTYPTGTVMITDTSSNLNGAFGEGLTSSFAEVVGGTNVTVTEAGSSVWIGAFLGTAADNPSGAIKVIETTASQNSVTIDGGSSVTVSAEGQSVFVGTTTGTAGAQSITQSSVYTGNALGSSNAGSQITDDGGTTVNINTTGGNVTVGSSITATPTGTVAITNTFSGAGTANASTVAVLGGSTVSITETNSTSGNISVGTAPVLNSGGNALKNAALEPTGNVTINNSVTNGSTTTYGTSTSSVYTNGATTVSVTGAGATTVADVNQFTATATGNPVGTSVLATVNLDGVAGAVAISSG